MPNWNLENNKNYVSHSKHNRKADTPSPSYSNVLDDDPENVIPAALAKSLSDNWKYLIENNFLSKDCELVKRSKRNEKYAAYVKEENSSTSSSTSQNSVLLNTLGSLSTLTEDEKNIEEINTSLTRDKNIENVIMNTNEDVKSNNGSINCNSKELTNAIFEMTTHITNYLTPVRSHENSSSFPGFTRLSKFCFNFYVENTNTIGTASFDELNQQIIINEGFRSDITLNNSLSSGSSLVQKSSSEVAIPIPPKNNMIMYLNQPRCSEPSIHIVNKPTVVIDPNDAYLSDNVHNINYNDTDTEYRKRIIPNKRENKSGNGVTHIEAQEGKTFLDSLETPRNIHRFDNLDISMDQIITNVRTDDVKIRSCAEEYRNPIISEVTVAIDVAVRKLEDTLLSRISQQIKEAIDKLEQISENNMKSKLSYINSKESFNQSLQCNLIGIPLVYLAEKGEQIFHYTERPRSFMQMNLERNKENQAAKREENVLRISEDANTEVKLNIFQQLNNQEKKIVEPNKASIFRNFLRYNFQIMILVASFFVGVAVMYRLINMLLW